MRPYTDIQTIGNVVVREFGAEVDPVELMWHRDNEERVIESLAETDWMIQLEDQLPCAIDHSINIKKIGRAHV